MEDMIQVSNNGEKDELFIKVNGKVNEDYYDVLLPVFEKKMEEGVPLKVYFEFEDFDHFETSTIWKDLKFEGRKFDNFKKIAIVGEESWLKWITELTQPFAAADIRFFKPQDKEIAKEWISGS